MQHLSTGLSTGFQVGPLWGYDASYLCRRLKLTSVPECMLIANLIRIRNDHVQAVGLWVPVFCGVQGIGLLNHLQHDISSQIKQTLYASDCITDRQHFQHQCCPLLWCADHMGLKMIHIAG